MKTPPPFTKSGRRLRLCLLPVSWIVAALILWGLLGFVAFLRHVSIQDILTTQTLWPLVLILPGFAFGKILGFMTANGMAHSLPRVRRIFEAECRTTGRDNYSRSMRYLRAGALVAGGCVVLGVIVFLGWA